MSENKGLYSTLTPEQQARVKAYDGPENIGPAPAVDRAEICVQRAVNCGWLTLHEPHGRQQLLATIRIALDMEVAEARRAAFEEAELLCNEHAAAYHRERLSKVDSGKAQRAYAAAKTLAEAVRALKDSST